MKTLFSNHLNEDNDFLIILPSKYLSLGKKNLIIYNWLFSADKLEVTGMKGLLDEEVPFFVRVQAFQKATKWLKSLEQNMKNTMTTILQGCVQARMEEG